MSRPLDTALNEILTSAQLPTLPAVAAHLLELTAQADVAIADISQCIAQDLGLSAKILKVANSSFYSFPQQITSVHQAVSLLGINAVQNLALSFSFLSMGNRQEGRLFNFDLFWERSLVAATAARLIAGLVPRCDADQMFTISLLQNIGQLVFALTMPSRYDHVLELLALADRDDSELALEQEFLALPHTLSGSEVVKMWGLPSVIQAVVRYHHEPDAYPGDDPQIREALKIVYLADLVTKIFYSCAPERHYKQLHHDADRFLQLDGRTLKNFLESIHQDIKRAARYFDVTVNPIRPVAEILQEANIRLSLLHLSYEEINQELIRAKKELEAVRQQLTERNHQLEKLANIDGLTEIHNHRYFQQFLHNEINRSTRNSSDLSLLLADVDHFKLFNDTYGHQTGDFILKELCLVARSVIREYDLIARYGGEEFAFVLPDTTAKKALLVANRICDTIANHDFSDGHRHYRVSVSIGVTSSQPTLALNQNYFIGEADQALYQAKSRGRNRAVLFHSQPQKQLAA